MSLMESAPATIPATSARIFAVAFAPPFAAILTRSDEQRRQPAPVGQRHHRHQPGARHEVRIIEPHRRSRAEHEIVASSGCPSSGINVTVASHILPAQRGIRALRPTLSTTFTGAVGSATACGQRAAGRRCLVSPDG